MGGWPFYLGEEDLVTIRDGQGRTSESHSVPREEAVWPSWLHQPQPRRSSSMSPASGGREASGFQGEAENWPSMACVYMCGGGRCLVHNRWASPNLLGSLGDGDGRSWVIAGRPFLEGVCVLPKPHLEAPNASSVCPRNSRAGMVS